jgi:protein-S-isoprenylcysteine O-methyltransferase Ste14
MRENMLIGTVLDSFCISNYRNFCGKDIVIGKIAAVANFLLQDLPQTVIHVLFLYVDKSHTVDHHDWTISTGLIVSSVAAVIALWNACMFPENEFDPVILELELMNR